MNDSAEVQVHDNRESSRFEVTIDGETAYLEYTRGPHELALIHTEVPPSLSGRGLGSRLNRHALDLARAEGLQVTVVCPFALGFVDRHPEYGDLLSRPTGPAVSEPPWM
jgi:predicted GNAT family acetyltransferase